MASRVAFFEHQSRFDDRGWVKVVDRTRDGHDARGRVVGPRGTGVDAGRRAARLLRQRGGGVGDAADVGGGRRRRRPRVRWSACRAASSCTTSRANGQWLAVREDLAFGVRARVPGQERRARSVVARLVGRPGDVARRAVAADGRRGAARRTRLRRGAAPDRWIADDPARRTAARRRSRPTASGPRRSSPRRRGS